MDDVPTEYLVSKGNEIRTNDQITEFDDDRAGQCALLGWAHHYFV